jgi:hypothetical protein
MNTSQFRFYLGEKGIPTVDVVSLDELYGVDPKFDPLPPAASYVIVGGRMTAGDMGSNGFKDDPDCTWGEEAEDTGTGQTLIDAGYGWNRALGAQGFCHVIADIVPSDHEDPAALTVVGGIAVVGPESGDGAGTVVSRWGTETSKRQTFAKLKSYVGALNNDVYVHYCWWLDSWGGTTALFTGGEQRRYNATESEQIDTQCVWGNKASASSKQQIIAAGRTWIDSSPDHGNANSACVGFLV